MNKKISVGLILIGYCTLASAMKESLNDQLLAAVQKADYQKAEQLIIQGASVRTIDSNTIESLKIRGFNTHKRGPRQPNKYYKTLAVLKRNGRYLGMAPFDAAAPRTSSPFLESPKWGDAELDDENS